MPVLLLLLWLYLLCNVETLIPWVTQNQIQIFFLLLFPPQISSEGGQKRDKKRLQCTWLNAPLETSQMQIIVHCFFIIIMNYTFRTFITLSDFVVVFFFFFVVLSNNYLKLLEIFRLKKNHFQPDSSIRPPVDGKAELRGSKPGL